MKTKPIKANSSGTNCRTGFMDFIGVDSSSFVVNLKKQSQFVPGIIGAKSYMKGDYGN